MSLFLNALAREIIYLDPGLHDKAKEAAQNKFGSTQSYVRALWTLKWYRSHKGKVKYKGTGKPSEEDIKKNLKKEHENKIKRKSKGSKIDVSIGANKILDNIFLRELDENQDFTLEEKNQIKAALTEEEFKKWPFIDQSDSVDENSGWPISLKQKIRFLKQQLEQKRQIEIQKSGKGPQDTPLPKITIALDQIAASLEEMKDDEFDGQWSKNLMIKLNSLEKEIE